MKTVWKKLKQILTSMYIVDLLLILFLLILFCYMIFHLFSGADNLQENNTVDVIVRTSLAAVIGYFVSGNFGASSSSSPEGSGIPVQSFSLSGESQTGLNGQIRNQIGFKTSDGGGSQPQGGISLTKTVSYNKHRRIQLLVVSAVGLISLLTLLLTRYLPYNGLEYTAIISQLRDFVSLSIGFLISYGKNISS